MVITYAKFRWNSSTMWKDIASRGIVLRTNGQSADGLPGGRLENVSLSPRRKLKLRILGFRRKLYFVAHRRKCLWRLGYIRLWRHDIIYCSSEHIYSERLTPHYTLRSAETVASNNQVGLYGFLLMVKDDCNWRETLANDLSLYSWFFCDFVISLDVWLLCGSFLYLRQQL